MRLAAIAALLCATAAVAQVRDPTPRQRPANDGALLRVLAPPGAGHDSTSGDVRGTYGEPVTFTRSSAWTCTDSNGTIRDLAANKPCVVDGLSLGVRGPTTNLLLRSEEMDVAPWVVDTGALAVTSNTWGFGRGVSTGDTITDNDPTLAERRAQFWTTDADGTYTFSVYAAAGTTSKLWVFFHVASGGCSGCNAQWTDLTASAQRKTLSGAVSFPATAARSTAVALGVTRRPAARNGRWYEVTTAGTTGAGEPTWCTTTGCTVADGTAVWTDRGANGILVVIGVSSVAADTGSSRIGGMQLVTGSQPGDYCPTGGTSATCAGESATVPTPATLSATEGAARFCFTPSWTGAAPSDVRLVSLRTATPLALLGYVDAGGTFIAATNGASFPLVAADYSAGVRRCYRTDWSVAANRLRITNLTSGASAQEPFSGFAAPLAGSLSVGSDYGASQANGNIDSVCLSSSPEGCR